MKIIVNGNELDLSLKFRLEKLKQKL
jgi:hypothetical protein